MSAPPFSNPNPVFVRNPVFVLKTSSSYTSVPTAVLRAKFTETTAVLEACLTLRSNVQPAVRAVRVWSGRARSPTSLPLTFLPSHVILASQALDGLATTLNAQDASTWRLPHTKSRLAVLLSSLLDARPKVCAFLPPWRVHPPACSRHLDPRTQIRKRAHDAVRQLLTPGGPAASVVAHEVTRFARTTLKRPTSTDAVNNCLHTLVFLKDAFHLLPLAVRGPHRRFIAR